MILQGCILGTWYWLFRKFRSIVWDVEPPLPYLPELSFIEHALLSPREQIPHNPASYKSEARLNKRIASEKGN